MPQIRELGYTEEAVGPVRRGSYTGDDFGAQGARAVQELGNTVSVLTEKLGSNYMESQASRQLSDAQVELQRFTSDLQNGTADADGNSVAPPDPTQHARLYREKVESIRDRVTSQNFLSGGTTNLFNRQYDSFAEKQGIVVDQNALSKFRLGARSNLETTLEQQADTFVDADDLQKPGIQGTAFGEIDRAVQAGVLDENEARLMRKGFTNEVGRASLRKLIRTDSAAAIIALEGGEFNELDAEETQKWIDVAQGQYERDLNKENAEAERMRIAHERDQREIEEKTAKVLWDMQSKGTLAPETVENHADNLTLDEYKSLVKASSGISDVRTNPLVYADLRVAAGQGADVRGAAKKAYQSGQLDRDSFEKLMGETETNSALAAKGNWYKRGKDTITMKMQPDAQIGDLVAQRDRMASALEDWQRWSTEHQNATPEEAERESKRLANDFSIVSREDLLLTKARPRFLRGDLNTPDIANTVKATEEAFQKKQIDEFEFRRQMRLLDEWDRLLPEPEVKGKDNAKAAPKKGAVGK
jgi:hypothetical protein